MLVKDVLRSFTFEMGAIEGGVIMASGCLKPLKLLLQEFCLQNKMKLMQLVHV